MTQRPDPEPTTPAAPADPAACARRIAGFFAALAPADLDRLGEIYTEDVRFKDPFNEVSGLPAVRAIFAHMFEALVSPRFVVTHTVVDGAQCFLAWEFRFGMARLRSGQEQVIVGGSHLLLAPDGRIAVHRDYWDAAEELYEKLPLLGVLMRWLRRQMASPG